MFGTHLLSLSAAGVSRSTTLVLAYLMKIEKMTLAEAYKHVKGIRPVIDPNYGFKQQLMDYEKSLFGKNSVTSIHEFSRL